MKGKVKDGAEMSSLGYQENGDPINGMWGIQRSCGGLVGGGGYNTGSVGCQTEPAMSTFVAY